MTTPASDWQKSSYSVDASNCLEIGRAPGNGVAFRESEEPSTVLVTDQKRLRTLLAVARRDEV